MSNTSFKTVIEEYPAMLFAIDQEGQIFYWNRASTEMTGFSATDAQSNPHFLKHFIDDKNFLEAVSKIQKEAKDVSSTFSNIPVLGSDESLKTFRFIVRYRQNPILDKLNTWIIGFDETEQTILNNEINLSKARFEMISKATNDAIWEWEIGKDTLWWGEGIMDLFGHPEGGQYTSFQWWVDRVHADDRDRVVKKLREVAENGHQTWSDEYKFKRKDGTYCTVQDKGMTICDEKGIAIRMIGGMSDITEKKIYEHSLIVKNQQLAEYAFFNSHKVRAPLARLLSCVSILQVEGNLDADTLDIINAVKLSAEELDKEIREIGFLLSMDSNLGSIQPKN